MWKEFRKYASCIQCPMIVIIAFMVETWDESNNDTIKSWTIWCESILNAKKPMVVESCRVLFVQKMKSVWVACKVVYDEIRNARPCG